MKAKNRKRGIIIAVILLLTMLAGMILAFYPAARDGAEEAILEKALSNQDDLANIVFKMFSLTQGEGGLEAWRLKAEVASVRKDSGIIHVEKPKITYFTRPDNQEVMVAASWGVVDQGERNMELWPDVLVIKEDNTLKTTKMLYRESEHTLFFPVELIVESDTILARADEASWDLKNNIFEARGGVTIHFKPRPNADEPSYEATNYADLLAKNATRPTSTE